MPLSSRSLQRIGVVTANGTFKAAMSSSNFSAWGRNQCPRGFCDRASVGGYQGLSEVDAFGSGYSHARLWRGSNYGYWQVYNGPFFQARGAQQQQFRLWSSSHPGLPPKSADHRNWILAASQPPLECERFKVLSYNILADYLALDHQSNLYFHIPNHIMAWEWRKRRLFIEFGLWSPDIMCLQEVDRFCDLEGELAIRGYAGIWKMRTGNAVDGCAIFWRTNRFQLRHEEHIEFSKLGLRDNVAQICVLETKRQYLAENVFTALPTSYCQSTGANQVIVCNIHVLYNPKRGEIKLGQVRVLLDRAYAVSKDWNNAPVIICGDFNSTPMSPLYKFIATQKLNFSGLGRDQISGQYSATVHRPNYGVSSYRCESFSRHESEGAFGTHQGYYKCTPDNQHSMGNLSPFDNSNAIMYTDVQLKVDKQMPFGATAIKLGEAEIFSHQDGGTSSVHSKLANLPSITSEISCQQNIIHGKRETDKNSREAFKNILDVSCFEDRKFSPGSGDFAGGIKLSSTFGIDNLTSSSLPKNVNFHGFQKDINYVGKASSFHSNIDDFSTLTSCEGLSSDAIAVDKILHVDVADDTFSKEKPSTSCESFEMPMVENIENSSTGSAIAGKAAPLIELLNSGKGDDLDLFKFDGSHVSDRMAVISFVEDEKVMENMNYGGDSKKVSSDKILQDIPTLCDNLSREATSAENRHSLELPCLEENEDIQSLELSGLEKNEDPNFLKELLGMEDQIQTTKDFNSPNMVHFKDSSFPLSSAASNIERYLCNPYCWSPMEMEIASGKEKCTVVEHPLKLRSVYRDVEDYTGTKDSSKEPQVTSYNRQFMGTVDYIWCSEDLLTTTVLDTIPKHVLQRTPGFPTQKWGSDHIALVCELAFSEGSQKK